MVIFETLVAAVMSTVIVCPFTIGAPLLHRVPASPSSIRAGTSPPPEDDAVALQPVRGSTVWPGVVPPTTICVVSRTSRDDEPTYTWWVPTVLAQPPAVQVWKARPSRVTEAC